MPEDPDATVRLNGAAIAASVRGRSAAPCGSAMRAAVPPAFTGPPRAATSGASSSATPVSGPAASAAAATMRSSTARFLAAAAGGGVALGAVALWLALREPAPPPSQAPSPPAAAPQLSAAVVTPPARPVEPPADPGPPLLAEAEILAHRAAVPTLLRLASNPRVFVLDFPDLAAQGAALNRVAALIEKVGLPRDRLLSDIELVAAIARSRDTPETWYYGHDYRGTDLARFFALAERDGIALTPLEVWVRAQFERARRLVPEGDEIALISVAGSGPGMDAATRAAILRHELGHGHYFTLPAYAAHVRRVWREGFTEAERAAFRRFLDAQGYDTGDEDLMMNEAQAYLIHTPDPGIFNASHLGLPEAQVERMRDLMRAGAPLPF